MNLISGVLKEDYSDYVLYFVESLSDELKQEIRSRLSAVCHGVDQAQSAAKIYSYKETAKEFVKRYKSDKNASEKRKKGMIGELLVHIILEIEGRFTTASPFFNMEERSFKKGYDVALFEEKTNELWIAEVKSGEIQKNQKDASAAATGLINTAKNDLKVRLNDYNTSLWLNALNAAKVTEWNDAFTEQYISGDICRSEQQDALIKFFEKKYNNTISISAPTSYGKSELILSTIKEYKGRKICVLTSTKALLTQTKKRIQQISSYMNGWQEPKDGKRIYIITDNTKMDGFTDYIKSEDVERLYVTYSESRVNLGIHYYRNKLYTSNLVGICRIKSVDDETL